jgi:hypothetical protein
VLIMAEGSDDSLFEDDNIIEPQPIDSTPIEQPTEERPAEDISEQEIPIPEDETIAIQDEEQDAGPQEIVNLFDSSVAHTGSVAPVTRAPSLEDKVFGMLRKKKPVAAPGPVQAKPVAAATPKPGETTAQMIARLKKEKAQPSSPQKQGPATKEIPEVDSAKIPVQQDITPDKIPAWDATEPPRKKNYIRPIVVLLALVILAAGAYSIYSELPTHPMLTIGIVMCSAASGIIMNILG